MRRGSARACPASAWRSECPGAKNPASVNNLAMLRVLPDVQGHELCGEVIRTKPFGPGHPAAPPCCCSPLCTVGQSPMYYPFFFSILQLRKPFGSSLPLRSRFLSFSQAMFTVISDLLCSTRAFMPVGNIGAVVGARRAQQRRGRNQSASSQAPRVSRPEVTLRTEDVQYVEAPKRSQRGDLSSLPPKPQGCCVLM